MMTAPNFKLDKGFRSERLQTTSLSPARALIKNDLFCRSPGGGPHYLDRPASRIRLHVRSEVRRMLPASGPTLAASATRERVMSQLFHDSSWHGSRSDRLYPRS